MPLLKYLILSRRPDYTIAFPCLTGKQLNIPVQAMVYLEAEGNLTKVHLQDRQTKTVELSISQCEEILEDYAFVRIHRSFMVNCSYIQSVNWTNEILLELYSDQQLPIARRRKTEFKNQLQALTLDHL